MSYLRGACITKGVPLSTHPGPSDDASAASDVLQPAPRCNVLAEDLPFPVAVLKDSAMNHNRRWMRAFIDGHGVALAPHGKTTMSPQLFKRQIDDGAWGMTAATAQQAAVMQACGIRRVLIANQLAGRAAMLWAFEIGHRDPGFELFATVDSIEGVDLLQRTAAWCGASRALPLLVEMGVAGGRTGCRSLAQGLEVARAVDAAPGLALAGVEGYEGAVPGADPQAVEAGVREFVQSMADLAGACADEDLFQAGPILLSAGGSAYFDLVTALPRRLAGRAATVVLRSGCYLTFDDGYYREHWRRLIARTPALQAMGEGLRPALEIWSCVQSTPEPGLAILTMGKRDVSHDIHLPFARWRVGRHDAQRRVIAAPADWTISALNDQHAFLRFDPNGGSGDGTRSRPVVGDLVGCTVSHPCTTFDKWRSIPVVDDRYDVMETVDTCF